MRSGRVTGTLGGRMATLAPAALLVVLAGCSDGDRSSAVDTASAASTIEVAVSPSGDVTPEPAPTVTVTATAGSTGTGTVGSAATPTAATRSDGVKTGGVKTATGAPTDPVTETLDRIELPGGSSYVNFASPSGNIQCAVGDESAECVAFEAAWTLPDPGDCELDWAGDQLSVFTGESFAGSCRGDTFLVTDPPVLQYGQEYVRVDMRCVSREDGVTCEYVPTGAGFRIARGTYDIF